jgi:hypothetical protein
MAIMEKDQASKFIHDLLKHAWARTLGHLHFGGISAGHED